MTLVGNKEINLGPHVHRLVHLLSEEDLGDQTELGLKILGTLTSEDSYSGTLMSKEHYTKTLDTLYKYCLKGTVQEVQHVAWILENLAKDGHSELVLLHDVFGYFGDQVKSSANQIVKKEAAILFMAVASEISTEFKVIVSQESSWLETMFQLVIERECFELDKAAACMIDRYLNDGLKGLLES